MGDALAVALLDARGFTSDDFARSHPAGALGKRSVITCEAFDAHWRRTTESVSRYSNEQSICTKSLTNA